MDTIFWYFVKEVQTGKFREKPLCYNIFMGDIGEHLFDAGIEYEILDYAKENVYWTDLICD